MQTAEPPGDPVREIFDHAVELRAEEREAFIKAVCGGDADLLKKVRELLEAHDSAGAFLSDPAIDPAALGGELPATGHRIGPYKLLRVLGEGGYGVVYLAEQDPPLRRRVALKVIKAGMDTRQVIARFDVERQALALLDHPGISRVLDAGATEAGRPYFVMELVEGEPITRYCQKHHTRLDDRLRLFIGVCAAVQHAHSRGILHRDIKPGNVLVSTQDGQPIAKVIDFGIAKAIGREDGQSISPSLTLEAQMLGTPQYMSPEQADPSHAHVDSRTDVYGLGGLLYELLCDAPPLAPELFKRAAIGETARILTEVDPPLPSTRVLATEVSPKHVHQLKRWSRRLRGDLDRIAAKALEKDPSRRYENPEELAADVRRYLEHEPVLARGRGALYRARKFTIRRRRAIGLFLIAIICGGIGSGIALSLRRPLPPKTSLVPTTFPTTSTALVPATKPLEPLLPGLIGRYYSDIEFKHFVTQRIDREIEFHWSTGVAPAPGVGTPKYGVRWTGVVIVPPGGIKRIGFYADDGARLRIDGQLKIETHSPMRLDTGPEETISPGRHTIQLDYWNKFSLGDVRLHWAIHPGKVEPIPADCLFHTASDAALPTTR